MMNVKIEIGIEIEMCKPRSHNHQFRRVSTGQNHLIKISRRAASSETWMVTSIPVISRLTKIKKIRRTKDMGRIIS